MISEERKYLDIYKFIQEHQDDVIIFGYGGTHYPNEIGYYKFALVYKMHIKIIEGEASGSANRCILEGIYAAVQRISKACNVYVLTSTALGFKKAMANKGPNKDLCQLIMSCAEIKKGCNLEVYFTKETAEEMRNMIRYPERFFKVIK